MDTVSPPWSSRDLTYTSPPPSTNDTNTSVACPTSNKEAECSTYLFVNNFVVMGVLCVVGTGGNMLTVATLYRDSKRNVTSFLLTMLALGDTGFLLMTVLLRCLPVLCTYTASPRICHFRYYHWPHLVRLALPVALVTLVFSVWVILLVTVHRAIAVLRPHRARQYVTVPSVRLQCALLAMLAVVFNMPRFFEMRVHPNPHPACPPLLSFAPFFYSRVYNIVYKNVLVNIFVNVGPLVVLSVLTFCLVREIRHTVRRRRRLSCQADDAYRNGVQLTVLLLLVVIVFILCQIPHTAYALLRVLLPASFRCPHSLYYFVNTSDALVVFNSSVNFFLYCLAGRRFRQHLRQLFRRGVHHKGSRTLSSQKGTGVATPLTNCEHFPMVTSPAGYNNNHMND